jgi:sarcosine oxidase subunit beta
MTASLPPRADVVVIGGGAIGTSIAFHLAEAGAAPVLLERGSLASGSTSRAAGGIRAQFSDPLNVEICRRSIEAFSRFAERPGGEIDFHQVGYLFLLDRPEDVEAFEQGVALQGSLGVPSRLVTPEQAAELSPLAGLDGVLAATFCPLDGHASPESVTQGYAAGARSHGGSVLTETPALEILVNGGEVVGIRTAKGVVETGTVVCAAGVWSPDLARTAGVELPVQPVWREVVTTAPVEGLPARIPLTVDFTTGLYFHREGPGLLIGMADRSQQPGFDAPTDPAWLERVIGVAERRAPSLLEMGLGSGWRGYYEVTPDHNGLVGEAPGASRFLYATGFSGHGFMQAPAVGEIVRDLVLGREPFVDVSPLAVERFAAGAPRPERNVI